MQDSRIDLENRFTFHPAKEEQAGKYEGIRAAAKGFAKHVCEVTPASREQSLAITAIEEAVFWANAAIARNE